MIKLIINYTFQKPCVGGYTDPKRAMILSFRKEDFSKITNEFIRLNCAVKERVKEHNIVVVSIEKI